MSETVKTWDGLRVWKPLWYPKHPQLSLRAIPDRMAVLDSRPRPADIFNNSGYYGTGNIVLKSPSGIFYGIEIEPDDAVILTVLSWQVDPPDIYIGNYKLTVADDGALVLVAAGATITGYSGWYIANQVGAVRVITVDPDGAMHIGDI